MAAFSFQGAKILSTGEGGMLVSDNTGLFERAKHFAEHGRSGVGFDISDIGFKYKMSNLQAAWGLAQLERIDELVAKRREIYWWYSDRLNGIEGISLNRPETYYEKPIYWMTSVVLDKDFGITRDEVIVKLRKRMIDTRPFFPRMSTFKMFQGYDNPVAEHISANGINLPSAHDLTEEEADYVCRNLKEVLGV